MLCPRNGLFQLRCIFRVPAIHPDLIPASPGFGINPYVVKQSLVCQVSCSRHSSTPLRQHIPKGSYCHTWMPSAIDLQGISSVTACMLRQCPSHLLLGCQSLSPLCKFFFSLKGDDARSHHISSCLYLGVPYAAIAHQDVFLLPRV